MDLRETEAHGEQNIEAEMERDEVGESSTKGLDF